MRSAAVTPTDLSRLGSTSPGHSGTSLVEIATVYCSHHVFTLHLRADVARGHGLEARIDGRSECGPNDLITP